MSEVPGLYKLPSGSYNVKLTFAKRKFNLGTYHEAADALEVLAHFKEHATETLKHHGIDVLLANAAKLKVRADGGRRKRPRVTKTPARSAPMPSAVKDKLTVMQTQNDQLDMRVSVLEAKLNRLLEGVA